MVGRSVGPYTITAKLGEGGMGEVYRARDTRLDRDVAVKVLPDAFAADRDRLARFEREAKTLASLNHPHIAHVHGFERVETTSALIMEFVEGEDLSQRIARGPIPLDEALPIARQIAEALEVAHDHGIIHRDLKPANIKVRSDSEVKVLDFGLAKAIESAGAIGSGEHAVVSSPTITTPAMTMRGVILGTAAYMAPEQAKGKPVDRRADVWAFGCVLYEMLSGRRPFVGEDVSETLAAVLKEQPEWKPLPSDTPANVRKLIERCLQKDPQKRLPHIGVARLELAEPVGPISAPVVRQRSLAPWIALSGLLAVTLTAMIAWVVFATAPAPAPARSLHANMDIGVAGSLLNGTGASAVLSADGTTLAFVAATDVPRLYVRALDRLEATPLKGTEGASDPFFSPDGQWIGFFADSKLRKVAVKGGAPIALADIQRAQGAWWGDDDQIVFSPTFNLGPLRRVSAVGGAVEILRGSTDPALRVQRWPQVLPGAKRVLFTANQGVNAFSQASIAVQDLAGGEPKVVHRGGYYGRYLPSGHLVFMNSGTLFAVRFDLERLETAGTPTPVLSNVVGNPDNGGAQFSFSNDGSFVAMLGAELSMAQPIVWIDRKGATQPLMPKPLDWTNINVAPDGRRLALNMRDGQPDVWLFETERQSLSRLSATSAYRDYPVWTPDGRRVTFSSPEAAGGPGNIYWQPADGSGSMQRLTQSPNPQRAGGWHPSGKALAFHEINPKTANDIWILPMEGDEQSGWKPGQPFPFVTDPLQQVEPVFSPDGKWIAYWSLESGSEVFVRPYPGPGGKWQISSGGGILPAWSRTRNELFYQTLSGTIMVVSYRVEGNEFRADRPRPWADLRVMTRGGGQRSFALHPDGERIAATLVPAAAEAPRDRVMLIVHFFDELRRAVPAPAR